MIKLDIIFTRSFDDKALLYFQDSFLLGALMQTFIKRKNIKAIDVTSAIYEFSRIS